MAKAAYVGVNGTPKKITNMYVGVNGTPKKVLKGYVGVNGVPKLFWDGGSPVSILSWNYWTTSDNFEIVDDYAHDLYKTNKRIAYYAVVHQDTNRYIPILISPNSDAVTYSIYDESTGTSESYTYNGTVTDVNNITWYYCYGGELFFDTEPEFSLSTSQMSNAASDLLDLIYAVPFQEDYQGGSSYTFSTYADVEKTIRKYYGLFLAFNVGFYGGVLTSYTIFSDNVDSIITNLLSGGTGRPALNDYSIIVLNHRLDTSNGLLQTDIWYSNSLSTNQLNLSNKRTYRNLDYFDANDSGSTLLRDYVRAYITRFDSNVNYGTGTSAIRFITIGINSRDVGESQIGSTSNLGIDL